MLWLYIVLAALAALVLLVLLICYICFRMAFLAKPDPCAGQEYPIPPGAVYQPHRPIMEKWIKLTRQIPCQEFSVTSFDGLKLYGKYYECQPGAPIELMFHGYRGLAERDLCGGVQRCFALGRNALLVDQRTAGKSEGKVISFGINERRDCITWVDFMVDHFGPDVRIILTGISMGAATVMMASQLPLPKNVVGIIADCGYTSPKEIICRVIRQMKLPAFSYFFLKLAARIYGGFDLEEASPIEAMKECKIPVFFAHGEADDFVPCQMSIDNYNACTAPKRLLVIPAADHGLGYIYGKEDYLRVLREMEQEYTNS